MAFTIVNLLCKFKYFAMVIFDFIYCHSTKYSTKIKYIEENLWKKNMKLELLQKKSERMLSRLST